MITLIHAYYMRYNIYNLHTLPGRTLCVRVCADALFLRLPPPLLLWLLLLITLCMRCKRTLALHSTFVAQKHTDTQWVCVGMIFLYLLTVRLLHVHKLMKCVCLRVCLRNSFTAKWLSHSNVILITATEIIFHLPSCMQYSTAQC